MYVIKVFLQHCLFYLLLKVFFCCLYSSTFLSSLLSSRAWNHHRIQNVVFQVTPGIIMEWELCCWSRWLYLCRSDRTGLSQWVSTIHIQRSCVLFTDDSNITVMWHEQYSNSGILSYVFKLFCHRTGRLCCFGCKKKIALPVFTYFLQWIIVTLLLLYEKVYADYDYKLAPLHCPFCSGSFVKCVPRLYTFSVHFIMGSKKLRILKWLA